MENLELTKLDINGKQEKTPAKSEPTDMPRRKHKFPKLNMRSRRVKILAGVLVVFVLFSVFLGLKAQAIYADAQRTYTQAKVAMDVLKTQNVIAGREELLKTRTEAQQLKKDLDSIGFLGYIPLAGGYLRDAQHMVNAANHGLSAGITTTESLIPYADVLGLQGSGGFTGGSAQDRIRLTVQTLGKVVPKIDAIEADLKLAQIEIDQVNANRYPNFWKFKEIRARIDQVQTLADEGVLAVEQGKPLIKVLPQLLGESETKKYLIIFQNDKELRPTGGFMTYYAIFKVDQGDIQVERSSNIYDLDETISNKPQAPEVLRKYLEVRTLNIRDTNLSPDFIESMDAFAEMYQESSAYEEVDGIIALDTHFLVNVIRILGEVEAAGLKFNAEIEPRCDCPSVVFVLEDQITRPVNYIRENRKALIGELLFSIMQKALSSSPREYWGQLVQQGMRDAQEKHVMFYLFDDGAQQGIEALGWAGKIRETEGDYLHINDANLGGAKSNLFVKQNVRMDYTIDQGKVTKKVTVSYRNPYKHSVCDPEAGQLCLNAPLRNWQRVYVPAGSTLNESRGSEVKVETFEDLGKTAFEGFMRVNPEGKAEISYTYTLPMKVEGDTLPLLIQKQPGTDAIPYEIYVNDKLVEQFDLRSDRELQIKL